MDYKDTLLLPKTDFPMRGNLPKNEPERYKKWFESDVYEKMKRNRVDLRGTSLSTTVRLMLTEIYILVMP